MARIYRKGRDGIYYAAGVLPSGERWALSTRTRRKREAVVVAEQLERDVRLRADLAAREEASLGWALRALVDSLRAGGKAAGTIRNTDTKARHLLRVLGPIPLYELEPPKGRAQIARYVAVRVEEGYARSTIAVEVNVLRMALRVAAREGKYRGDTRDLSVTELRGAHRPRKRWLTLAQARAAIAATPPQWREHVETYIGIGARRMELYGIEAVDVDAAANLVHIRGTKTHGADRWVPMPKRVRAILVRRAKATPAGPLFKEWTRVHNDLGPIAKAAGLEPFTVSDLRRTFASLLISAGVSPSVLKELLGHTTTRQIDLVYGHASDEAKQAAVRRHPLDRRGSQAVAVSARRRGTRGRKGTRRRTK